MKLVSEPISDYDLFLDVLNFGREVLRINNIPECPEACEREVKRISHLLSDTVEKPFTLSFTGKNKSAIGLVYAILLKNSFGWNVVQVRHEKQKGEDAVDAVVSPDGRYCVYPIEIVYWESTKQDNESLRVYEAIKNSQLPDVPRNSFSKIGGHPRGRCY
ncbi:hypothetical protein SAMN02745181_3666 [Rubritalea squalenifaciens DSM 18772]|uniref:Uncharacterized protein n=1 Tax=Rubritalea squalenifaciens DSM 18772 TaxID=1123071 RepID=A0A1M6RRG6_9BACT|nr:hypothetical protein [Rubritalea squalenifaciens]SHK35056.1 hypothetical protein SAMN02745181_3666 [Rubritalea squalenifaciens DSM 18772]